MADDAGGLTTPRQDHSFHRQLLAAISTALSRTLVSVKHAHPLVVGSAFGLVVVFIAVLVYLLIVAYWWPWSWAYPMKDGTYDMPSVFAAQVAFGQVWSGFVGVFLAGALGYFAIVQFSQQHQSHKLTLAIDSTGNDPLPLSCTLRIEDVQGKGGDVVTFVLGNYGNTVATWFTVRVTIPFYRLPLRWDGEKTRFFLGYDEWLQKLVQQPDASAPIIICQGTPEANWYYDGDPKSKSWRVTFSSGGSVASYPEVPLELFRFDPCKSNIEGPGPYECKYEIFTDRGPSDVGALRLQFVEQSASETAVAATA